MSIKPVIFFVGCAVSWFVALPVFVLGGIFALFVYAVLAEVADFMTGDSKKVDIVDARETARLMCTGH